MEQNHRLACLSAHSYLLHPFLLDLIYNCHALLQKLANAISLSSYHIYHVFPAAETDSWGEWGVLMFQCVTLIFFLLSLKNTNSDSVIIFLAFNPVVSFPVRCFLTKLVIWSQWPGFGFLFVCYTTSFSYTSGHSKTIVCQWPISQGVDSQVANSKLRF